MHNNCVVIASNTILLVGLDLWNIYFFVILIRLRANGRNNSQQCWDVQCIVGRIKPMSFCKPCVMSVRGPNSFGRAVYTDPTLLHHASAITEQKKCWESVGWKVWPVSNFAQQHATTSTNMQQVCRGIPHVTSNNVGSCWPTMLHPLARGLIIYIFTKSYTTVKLWYQNWELDKTYLRKGYLT